MTTAVESNEDVLAIGKRMEQYFLVHPRLPFFIVVASVMILGAFAGELQAPLSSEDFRWKIEMYLQGSLVIVGFLIIFAPGFNKMIGRRKYWQEVAKVLGKEQKEVKEYDPFKLFWLLRNALSKSSEKNRLAKAMFAWALFNLAFFLLLVVGLFSLILVVGFPSFPGGDRLPGIYAVMMGFVFFMALAFVGVFIIRYTQGYFTMQVDAP